jgi:hypothetical protein
LKPFRKGSGTSVAIPHEEGMYAANLFLKVQTPSKYLQWRVLKLCMQLPFANRIRLQPLEQAQMRAELRLSSIFEKIRSSPFFEKKSIFVKFG